MINFLSKIKFKELIDNFLLVNLVLVIFSAIFFIFSIVMQIRGNFIFINLLKQYWNPIIVPLITVLIVGALANGIISWLNQKGLFED